MTKLFLLESICSSSFLQSMAKATVTRRIHSFIQSATKTTSILVPTAAFGKASIPSFLESKRRNGTKKNGHRAQSFATRCRINHDHRLRGSNLDSVPLSTSSAHPSPCPHKRPKRALRPGSVLPKRSATVPTISRFSSQRNGLCIRVRSPFSSLVA